MTADQRRAVARVRRKIRKRLRRSPAVRTGLARVQSLRARRGVDDAHAVALESVVARLDRLEAVVKTATKEDIPALERGLREQRGLANRVSELADVVTELLVLSAQRDDPEFARIVARYRKGL